MVDKRCPNCSAQLNLNRARRQWECPYCGSAFEVSEQQDMQEPAQAQEQREYGRRRVSDILYFDKDMRAAAGQKNTGELIKSMNYCIEELGSPEAIANYIRKSLINDEDIASEGVNQKRIDAIRSIIAPEMNSDEHVIVYGDNGIFSRGKDFFVVTERRSIFVDRKKCRTVLHRDIGSIQLDDGNDLPSCRLGGNYATSITAVGNKYQLEGAIIAMICLSAFEEDPGRTKIRMY